MDAAEYKKAFSLYLETTIGSLIALRDKTGLTWRDRLTILGEVAKLIPGLIRCAMFFANILPGEDLPSGVQAVVQVPLA